MHKSRKLGIGLFGTAAVAAGAMAIPGAADADTCTVAVTLASGQQLSFSVDVPPGTPLSAINLPVTAPVTAVSESCAAAAPTTTTTAGTTTTSPAPVGVTGTTTTSASTTTTGSTTETDSTTTDSLATSPASPLGVTLQAQSTTKSQRSSSGVSTAPAQQPTSAADGEPTANNPTYSFALPGAASVGVPNFFIDSFDIPPFLLPIYQAAGIEYNVPWQVLAAINWIETDYGRDLSVSSAGAVGWMQFLPSTWERWGVDATGTGYADPYNPTDAIFTAARYLAAAGAGKNLSKAIFSYNHAGWYVQSVLLRAQFIGGMPADLVSSLTQLVEGHFPVAAASTYADDSVVKTAERKDNGSAATVTVDSGTAKGTNIFAKPGSDVIAVNDGKIVDIGHNAAYGNFIKLQDDNGNVYTYSGLGSIPKLYAVPKPVSMSRSELLHDISGGGSGGSKKSGAPTSAASAGLQPNSTVTTGTTTVPVATQAAKRTVKQTLKSLLAVKIDRTAVAQADKQATQAAGIKSSASAPEKKVAATKSASSASQSSGQSNPAQSGSVASKERLFANPTQPSSYAAGGEQQLLTEGAAISDFKNYFSDVLHLNKNQYTLAPLTKGSVVVAGTVLGRVGKAATGQASHVYFQVQPGGSKSAFIDPKPILDGWKLLEATSIYRANGLDPFLSSSKQATIGQILLESKSQLQETVLQDPRISMYACGRRDVAAGSIDRRVLAVMEYLASSGLSPTVSGLKCGAGTTSGIDAAGQTGASMDISAIDGIPIAHHTGTGSITDITIRRLLTLQGAMSPTEIISPISYKGQSNTLALPDHMNRIQVTFTPEFGTDKKLTDEVSSVLKPNQWIQLISHIGEIPEPSVPTSRSAYAIKTKTQ